MSVFTRLTISDIASFLEHYNCGELIQFDEIIEGVTNSNFRIKTSHGKFILTIYEHLQSATITELHNLQNHWHERNLKCAQVICNNQSQTLSIIHHKPAALIEHLAGDTYYSITSELCQQVGLTLAQLHTCAIPEEFNRLNPRGFDWIFSSAREISHDLTYDDKSLLQDELNFLSRFSSLSLPSGAIHADLFPDNVLVKDGCIQGFIDLDYACKDVFLFDVCVAINAWCNNKRGELDRLRMRDLLSAYTSIRPMTQEENLAIPMMLRATALRFWLSRLFDHIYVNKNKKIQQKDPQQFKNILLNRRKPLSGMQR